MGEISFKRKYYFRETCSKNRQGILASGKISRKSSRQYRFREILDLFPLRDILKLFKFRENLSENMSCIYFLESVLFILHICDNFAFLSTFTFVQNLILYLSKNLRYIFFGTDYCENTTYISRMRTNPPTWKQKLTPDPVLYCGQ